MQTELGLDGGAQFFAPRREVLKIAGRPASRDCFCSQAEAKTLEEELDELEAIWEKYSGKSPAKKRSFAQHQDINPSIEAEETAGEVYEARDAPAETAKKTNWDLWVYHRAPRHRLLFAIYHFEERIVQFHEPLAPALKVIGACRSDKGLFGSLGAQSYCLAGIPSRATARRIQD